MYLVSSINSISGLFKILSKYSVLFLLLAKWVETVSYKQGQGIRILKSLISSEITFDLSWCWSLGSVLTGQDPQGPAGPTGATGPQGIAGTNGNTILNGTTVPTSATGNNGDFYINTTTNIIYGPKTVAGWGTGTTLSGGSSGGSLSNTNFQVFDATGIFTVPAGVTKIMVECWGAGGGGSEYTYWLGSGNYTVYIGGGGGGYGKSIFSVSAGANYLVTVGTGGSYNNAGGNSSFGSLITSNGGASLYCASCGANPPLLQSVGGKI